MGDGLEPGSGDFSSPNVYIEDQFLFILSLFPLSGCITLLYFNKNFMTGLSL